MQKFYYFLGNILLKFCMVSARIPGFWRLWAWLLGFFLWIFSYRKKVVKKNLDIAGNFKSPEKKKFVFFLGCCKINGEKNHSHSPKKNTFGGEFFLFAGDLNYFQKLYPNFF